MAACLDEAFNGREASNVPIIFLKKNGDAFQTSTFTLPREHKEGAVVLCRPDSGILALLDSMHVAAWTTDMEGSINNCNQTACEILDTCEEHQCGEILYEKFVVDENCSAAKDLIESAVRGIGSQNRIDLISSKRSVLAANLQVSPRHWDGIITGTLVMATRDRDGDLMHILDRLGVACWSTDTERNIDDCNKTASKLSEWDKPEMLGHKFSDKLANTATKANTKVAVVGGIEGKNTSDLDLGLLTKNLREVDLISEVAPRWSNFWSTGALVMARPDATPDLDALGIAAWYTDLNGVVDDCNDMACRMIEMKKSEVLGLVLADDIIDQKHTITMKTAVKSGCAGKDSSSLDVAVLTKSKHMIPVSSDVMPRKKGTRLTGSIITARKGRGNDSPLDDLLNSLGVGAFYTDMNGVVDDVNPFGCRLIGRKKSDVLGLNFAEDIVREADSIEAKKSIEGAILGFDKEGLRARLMTKSYAEIQTTSLVTPRMNGGQITGSIIFARVDDTGGLMDLLNKLGIAAWFTDMHGEIDDCNETACRYAERTRTEHLGLTFCDELVSEESRRETRGAVDGAIHSGEDTLDFKIKILPKSKDSFRVFSFIVPRRSNDLITGSMILAKVDECVLPLLDRWGIAGWTTDVTGKINGCNDTATGLLQKERDEILGTSLSKEIVSDQDAAETRNAIERSLKGESTRKMEVDLWTSPGKDVQVQAEIAPFEYNRDVIGSLVMAREDEVRIILDHLEIGDFVCNLDGDITYASKASCAMLQKELNEIVGDHFVEGVVDSKDRDKATTAFKDAKNRTGSAKHDLSLKKTKKNNVLPTRSTVLPIRDGTRITGTRVFVQPDSGILPLMERLSIAAWITDKDGKIKKVNKTAVDFTEMPYIEQRGLSLSDNMVSYSDRAAVKAALDAAIKQEEDAPFLNVSLIPKTAPELPVEAIIGPILESGIITGSLVLARKPLEFDLLALFDELGIAAWFTDGEGLIDDSNEPNPNPNPNPN